MGRLHCSARSGPPGFEEGRSERFSCAHSPVSEAACAHTAIRSRYPRCPVLEADSAGTQPLEGPSRSCQARHGGPCGALGRGALRPSLGDLADPGPTGPGRVRGGFGLVAGAARDGTHPRTRDAVRAESHRAVDRDGGADPRIGPGVGRPVPTLATSHRRAQAPHPARLWFGGLGAGVLGVLCVLGVLHWDHVSGFADRPDSWPARLMLACYLPLLAWPLLLIATTWAYYRRRRNPAPAADQGVVGSSSGRGDGAWLASGGSARLPVTHK